MLKSAGILLRRTGSLVAAAGSAAAVALIGLCGLVSPSAAAEVAVDLELVLAVDASGSVDEDEFHLQLQGIAAGFRDEKVIEAISRGYTGQIAVALLVWSDAHLPKDYGAWHVIRTRDDAEAFALLVEFHPRLVRNGATGIGSGIAAAIDMMNYNNLNGARKVVDVSGDGVETPLDTDVTAFGLLIDEARTLAEQRSVTVNGLAILNNVPNLDVWYENNVRVGPGSFVMVADDYEDFARAMRAKLLKEIEQSAPVTWLERGGPAPPPGG